MPYELHGPALAVAFVAMLAMLVKYERRLTRWLLRSRKRRKRVLRRPAPR